ncbi:MAG: hypothetical protein R3B91_10640 [Planctomycetaceae bacterium]
MPKGLMKFMTDSEFLDLVKFLSMLANRERNTQFVKPRGCSSSGC